MRALKITALISLLTTIVLVIVLTALLAWLVRTEQGSRWLLEQGLGFVPVTIEVSGVSGTLADGLDINTLYIKLPLAEIRATEIVASWNPASLLTGVVDIDSAGIAELSVDILATESSDAAPDDRSSKPMNDPVDDDLFWLQLPIQINIESGHLDKLRINAAEFENLNIAGSIGHGHLEIETASAQIAGVNLQTSGELAGPAPGRLEATASWEMPA